MDRRDLKYCLERVFFNSLVPDEINVLRKLSSLLAYYSEDDITEELYCDTNRLHCILFKYELLEKSFVGSNIPTDYRCRLMNDGQQVPQFTFSPQITVEAKEGNYDAIAELTKELEEIDLAALFAYVRRKAIAAGDFAFDDEDK